MNIFLYNKDFPKERYATFIYLREIHFYSVLHHIDGTTCRD